MPVTNVTPNRNYQLPWGGPVPPANSNKFDVARIIAAFTAIDVDVANLIASLAAKAPLAGPIFTGNPEAPTQTVGNDSNRLATTAFVKAALDALKAGAPAAFDTLDEIAAILQDNPAQITDILTALANRLRVDAAQGLSALQKRQARQNAGAASVLDAGFNLIVNPRMQISQENGNTAGGVAGYHAADQWQLGLVSSAGVASFQRVQSATPRGSNDRLRLSVTTADASLAAGEYLVITHLIEGNRIAHLKWGTAGAVQVVLRFGFKGPAGTYSARFCNAGSDRSYVKSFVVSAGQANTDIEVELVVPGDITGAWGTGTGRGIVFGVTLACGTTFAGTDGVWQAGNILGATGQTNGWGSNTNVFEVFDAGLYADPYNIGVAPEWQPKDEAYDLRECMRYFERSNGNYLMFFGNISSGTGYHGMKEFQVRKRVVPTITLTNVSVAGFPATVGTVQGGSVDQFREARTANNSQSGGFFFSNWDADARL